MKTKLITLLTLTIFVGTYAQTFVEHPITNTAIGATCAHAVDFNGDGDLDVLSASRDDDTLAWFENLGNGNFGPEQVITTDALGIYYCYAADIDGDGDMDALSASQDDDTIAWYENTDGLGTFGPKQIITENADFAQTVYAEDLDGDGDKDVLSGSSSDKKIAWYENLDGLGDFGDINTNQNIISIDAFGAWSVYAADLDGDMDFDVLSASEADNKIAWYENTDGLGTFGPQQLITAQTNTLGARFVRTGDLDGDGDQDVVSASRDDDKIAWYENTDGQGDFGDINTNQNILTEVADFTTSVSTVDFNDDGHLDVLFNSLNAHTISVMYGDGDGNFGTVKVLTNEAERNITTEAVDINDDGIMDVLSSNFLSNEIAWYEGVLSVNEYTLVGFTVYPIPTTGILNIQSETTIVQIEIYNQLGQLVLANKNQNTIDISSVNQGVYFIKIKDEHGAFGVQKVIKK